MSRGKVSLHWTNLNVEVAHKETLESLALVSKASTGMDVEIE